jgi:endonuclease-3
MLTLPDVVDQLAGVYGEPSPPPTRTLFELVLLENVVYLADDGARARAFEALAMRVGTRPAQVLAAPDEALIAVAGEGILAENQATKLRRIAQLTQDEFGGDLERLRTLGLPTARRGLTRFPSIGEPGAEKILLFGRSHPVLGLESNGVRVLTRLGLVSEGRSYAATYRAVQRLVEPCAERGFDWLIRAHQLLRQHGQELCRRNRPLCVRCPLTSSCVFYAAGV